MVTAMGWQVLGLWSAGTRRGPMVTAMGWQVLDNSSGVHANLSQMQGVGMLRPSLWRARRRVAAPGRGLGLAAAPGPQAASAPFSMQELGTERALPSRYSSRMLT
jgi:hypothetical protein